jgi:hypothetical protein
MKPAEVRYFELDDDMTTDRRWYLDSPVGPGGEWLGTTLTRIQRYDGPTPLESRVHHEGPPLELTITQGAVPVVSERVAEIILKHARDEVHLIPVEVAGAPFKLWAINVLAEADCVDEQRSGQVVRYTEGDGRPDKIGEYSLIVELRIDPARAGGHAILRPRGWHVTVLVAEPLANDLVRAGVRCRLTPVS